MQFQFVLFLIAGEDAMDYANGNLPFHGALYEELRQEQCKEVVSALNHHLIEKLATLPLNNHTSLDLQLPLGLLQRMAKDIVSMSQCEPCGLRGCMIFTTVQQKSDCHKLGQIVFDPTIVSTFELHLTLFEDRKHWLTPFKDLLRPVMKKCAGENYTYRVVVSPGFQLVKKKLYRSEPK